MRNMRLTEEMTDNLVRLFHDAAAENLSRNSYANLCDMLGVAKMYYDMDLGGNASSSYYSVNDNFVVE